MAQAQTSIYPFLRSFEAAPGVIRGRDSVGGDASVAPREDDFRQFAASTVEGFMRKLSIIRLVSPRVDTTSFTDGKFSYETIVLNDIQPAKIAMEAGEAHTDVTGAPARTVLPELFQTQALSDRQWAQTLAGQDRRATLAQMFRDTIAEAETVLGFQGAPNLGINGLVSSLTTDDGNPAGVWDTDSGSDGRLTHFMTDFKSMKNTVLNYCNTESVVMDAVCTMPIYQLLSDTKFEETPMFSNLDWLKANLNGGNVYVSNLIQANVTVNSNTFVLIPRTGVGKCGHELIYSGFDATIYSNGKPWQTGFGLREIFSINLLGSAAKQITWMDAIDTVT